MSFPDDKLPSLGICIPKSPNIHSCCHGEELSFALQIATVMYIPEHVITSPFELHKNLISKLGNGNFYKKLN